MNLPQQIAEQLSSSMRRREQPKEALLFAFDDVYYVAISSTKEDSPRLTNSSYVIKFQTNSNKEKNENTIIP